MRSPSPCKPSQGRGQHPTTARRRTMTDRSPAELDGLAWAADRGMGALAEKMGMEFLEFTRRALRRDHAGRGQHAARRTHARRRLCRPRRVARLDGGEPARRAGPTRCRSRHQRHAHAIGDLGRRDRRVHAHPPRAQHGGARDRGRRRSGPPAVNGPDHQHDPDARHRGPARHPSRELPGTRAAGSPAVSPAVQSR